MIDFYSLGGFCSSTLRKEKAITRGAQVGALSKGANRSVCAAPPLKQCDNLDTTGP